MEGKLDSFLEVDVELELIQIDSDWPVFGTFRHFFIHSKRLKKQEILFELKMIEKTGRSEPYGNVSDATSDVNSGGTKDVSQNLHKQSTQENRTVSKRYWLRWSSH